MAVQKKILINPHVVASYWWEIARKSLESGTCPESIVLLIKEGDPPVKVEISLEESQEVWVWATNLPGWNKNEGAQNPLVLKNLDESDVVDPPEPEKSLFSKIMALFGK